MKRIVTALVIGLSLMMGTVSGALASDNSAEAIEACYQAPTTHCLLALALAEAKTLENDVSRYGIDVSRPRLLQEIAEAQLKAGVIKAALATAKMIEDADETGHCECPAFRICGWWNTNPACRYRPMVLRGIAVVQAESGDIKASRSTFTLAINSAKAIEDTRDRVTMLSAVVEAQAKAGDIKSALALVKVFEGDDELYDRSMALPGIAVAQVEAGDIKASQSTFTLAIDSAKTTEFPLSGWALSSIAAAQAEVGDIEAAFATVKIIENPEFRSMAMVLSHFCSGLSAHLGGLSFESQGAFSTQR